MQVPEDVWLTVGELRAFSEWVPPGLGKKLIDISTKWEQFCAAVQKEHDQTSQPCYQEADWENEGGAVR